MANRLITKAAQDELTTASTAASGNTRRWKAIMTDQPLEAACANRISMIHELTMTDVLDKWKPSPGNRTCTCAGFVTCAVCELTAEIEYLRRVTFAARCTAADLDTAHVDKIRAKQAAKPQHSPLPAIDTRPSEEVVREHDEWDTGEHDGCGKDTERVVRALEFAAMITRALARYNAMTPDQKQTQREAQQRSWVVDKMLLEHPKMMREYAERVYDDLAR